MRETEAYLNRATRGLWGQKRRDARTELRGAIEDKVYRHRLLGLSEAEASRAALRDLGSPHAIARDLSRIHTLPQAARAALLVGIATLVGVRAVAQVPTVSATSSTPITACKLDDAVLQRLIPSERERLRAELAKPGGRERLEAECRRQSQGPNDLLKLKDLLAALRVGGVDVQVLEGTDAFLSLRFPNQTERQPLNINDLVREIGGETYVPVGNLLGQLRYVLKAPVRLTGLMNPTLEIGPTRMQLGTKDQPVYSTNLYSFIVWNEISRELQFAAPDPSEMRNMVYFSDSGRPSSLAPSLSFPVSGTEGTIYAVVYGRTSQDGKAPSFALRAAVGGQVSFPLSWSGDQQPPVPRVVKTLPEFFQARSKEQPVALLYRVDTSDLRNLKLTPVPPVQGRLITQP